MIHYPLDVLLGIVGTIIWHLPFLVLINVVDNTSEAVSVHQGVLLLLYGLSVFGDGVQHTFAEALWQFGNVFIRTGDFDTLLTKPAPTLIQVLTSRFDVDGMGGIILGVFCCIFGLKNLNMFSIISVTKLILALIISGNIFLCINIFTSSTAFIITDNSPITQIIFQFHMFGRFPRNIYPNIISLILTLIIPIFFATYYPTQILQSATVYGIFLLLVISYILLFVSVFVWYTLSLKYDSSGS